MNVQEFIKAVENEASHFYKNVDMDELTIKLMASGRAFGRAFVEGVA